MSGEDLVENSRTDSSYRPTLVFPIVFRRKRRHVPSWIRNLIVILMGVSVGLLASYAVRSIGY